MRAKLEAGRAYSRQTRVEEWMTAEKAGNKGVDALSTPMLVQLTSVLLQLPPVLLPLSIVVIEPPVDCGQQLLIRHPITLPRRHKGVKKFSPV